MFRNFRRVAVVVAASMALVAGAAVVTPGEAAAATRYAAPTLKAEQGTFAGDKNVKLTITNTNVSSGLFAESTCSSSLLHGTEALQAFVAFNNKDYINLLKIIANSNSKVGPVVSNNLISPGPNSASREVNAADGVYIYLGTCGGIKSLEPGNVGVALLPVIVPSGVGSIGSVLDFGSAAMDSGMAMGDVLSLLSILGSGS